MFPEKRCDLPCVDRLPRQFGGRIMSARQPDHVEIDSEAFHFGDYLKGRSGIPSRGCLPPCRQDDGCDVWVGGAACLPVLVILVQATVPREAIKTSVLIPDPRTVMVSPQRRLAETPSLLAGSPNQTSVCEAPSLAQR